MLVRSFPSGGGYPAQALRAESERVAMLVLVLRAWCAEGLARFKVPETAHVIDGIPTTSGTNGTKIAPRRRGSGP